MAGNMIIALIGLTGLVLLCGVSYTEAGDQGLDPSECEYNHILELKKSSEADKERFGDFVRQFNLCIPLYGEWTQKAVDRMTPEQKELILEFHRRVREDIDMEENFGITVSKQFGQKATKDLMCSAQKFYQQLVKPTLQRLCSGFEGTLNDLLKIYELRVGADNDNDTVDEKLDKLKTFHINAVDITFEWLTYAKSCRLLHENRKYFSEEIRRLVLPPKYEDNWFDQVLHLKPTRPPLCDHPENLDSSTLRD